MKVISHQKVINMCTVLLKQSTVTSGRVVMSRVNKCPALEMRLVEFLKKNTYFYFFKIVFDFTSTDKSVVNII